MAQWNLDPAHSAANFTVRHMMVTNVRGSFGNLSGVINFDPENLGASSVDATIDVSTINTGVTDRDNHLRSADFFEVEKLILVKESNLFSLKLYQTLLKKI